MIKEKVSLSPVEESSADHPIPPPPPLPAAWALLDDFQRQRLVVSSLGASSLSPLLASLPPAELSFYRGRALRSLGRSYYGAALAEFRQCRRSWRFAEAQQEISSLDNSSIEFLAGAPDGDVCPLVRFSLNPAASRLLPTVRVVREAVESAGRLRFKLKMIENNNDK